MSKNQIFMRTHNPKTCYEYSPKISANIVEIYDICGKKSYNWNKKYIEEMSEDKIDKMEEYFYNVKEEIEPMIIKKEFNNAGVFTIENSGVSAKVAAQLVDAIDEFALDSLYEFFHKQKDIFCLYLVDKRHFRSFLTNYLPLYFEENKISRIEEKIIDKQTLNIARESFRVSFEQLFLCNDVNEVKSHLTSCLQQLYILAQGVITNIVNNNCGGETNGNNKNS